MIEAAAGRTEQERKIPADVLSAMHACGLFHMLLPISLGGGAVDLVAFNQVVEAVAAADASPAWCLAQAVASSHAAGFLDPKIAREVFGAPNALVAWGPPAGIAKALAVDGGYRVTGKWRFASGSANATWMGGHSTVFATADQSREWSALQHPVAHALWHRFLWGGARHRAHDPGSIRATGADQDLWRRSGLDHGAARQCGDPIRCRARHRSPAIKPSISAADAGGGVAGIGGVGRASA